MSGYIIKLRSDSTIAEDFATVFVAGETVRECGFSPMKKSFLSVKKAMRFAKPRAITVILW